MQRALGVAAGCALLSLFGCGSSDDTNEPKADTATTAEKQGDPRPRVEGKWRVVLTPEKADSDEERYTWEMTPECPAGACSFRVASATGNKFRFRFDKAIGDYLRKYRWTQDCVNLATDEVIVKDAYKIQTSDQLEVTASVISKGVDYATEMFGTSRSRSTLKPEAENTCDPDPSTDTLRAVRIDKPAGKPGSAAAPAAGE